MPRVPVDGSTTKSSGVGDALSAPLLGASPAHRPLPTLEVDPSAGGGSCNSQGGREQQLEESVEVSAHGARSKSFEISVQDLYGTRHVFGVQKSTTVGNLKSQLQQKTGIPPDAQRLLLNQETLENEARGIVEYGVQPQTIVSLTLQDEMQGAVRRKAREQQRSQRRKVREHNKKLQHKPGANKQSSDPKPAVRPISGTDTHCDTPRPSSCSAHGAYVPGCAHCAQVTGRGPPVSSSRVGGGTVVVSVAPASTPTTQSKDEDLDCCSTFVGLLIVGGYCWLKFQVMSHH